MLKILTNDFSPLSLSLNPFWPSSPFQNYSQVSSLISSPILCPSSSFKWIYLLFPSEFLSFLSKSVDDIVTYDFQLRGH